VWLRGAAPHWRTQDWKAVLHLQTSVQVIFEKIRDKGNGFHLFKTIQFNEKPRLAEMVGTIKRQSSCFPNNDHIQ
jgi:hypothetical protein